MRKKLVKIDFQKEKNKTIAKSHEAILRLAFKFNGDTLSDATKGVGNRIEWININF